MRWHRVWNFAVAPLVDLWFLHERDIPEGWHALDADAARWATWRAVFLLGGFLLFLLGLVFSIVEVLWP